MKLDDPETVRVQYATETGLAARVSLYGETRGVHGADVAFDALKEVAPTRELEVGCGQGSFAERVQRELGADVVAVDQSERMVELTRARGVDARVADVQDLPFDDAEFDAVAALWMLYHVQDVDRAVGEVARVLRPGGRFAAVTNAVDHLLEMWALVGAEADRLDRRLSFSAENGEAALRRHFPRVDRRDASGTVTIDSRDAVVRYLQSTAGWRHLASSVPEQLEPFEARRSSVVFVADK